MNWNKASAREYRLRVDGMRRVFGLESFEPGHLMKRMVLRPRQLLIAAAIGALLGLCGAALALDSSSPPERYAWSGDALLSRYIGEALVNHPQLIAGQTMVDKALAEKRTASSWMNPMATFAFMDMPTDFDLSRAPMAATSIGLMQTVPWPGKLSLSTQAAQHAIERTEWNLESLRWKLRTMVATSYFRLGGLIEQRKALVEAVGLADETVRVTRIAVSSGVETQAALLESQVERGKLERDLIGLEAEIEKARADLAYAVGKDTRIVEDPTLPLEVVSVSSPLGSLRDGIENAPSLESLKEDSLALHAQLRRARLEYFPDITVGARYGFGGKMLDEIPGEPGMYGWMKRDGRISFEVSLALPIWARGNQGALVAKKRAELERTKARLMDERTRRLSEARKLLLDIDTRARQVAITRDSLLVDAEYAYKSARLAYQGGSLPWTDLNHSRMTLSFLRMEVAMLAADYFVMRAELEKLLGATVEPGQ